MAAPRQLLLRLWGVGTLGLVLAIATGAYWWEQQLPKRLQSALAANDYEACIRTSEQLASLRWLGEGAPEEQALCRQKHAEHLWDQGDSIAPSRCSSNWSPRAMATLPSIARPSNAGARL